MIHFGIRWKRLLFGVVPVLAWFTACPLLSWFAAPPSTGTLEVDIDYTGSWYVETFGYAREAENIRHYVLVMPDEAMGQATSHAFFSSLLYPASPDATPSFREEVEYDWVLDYLYEAPEGHFVGQFAPGHYHVAVAFIAAPLSREEAGVSEDAILYAGITGGGASTDYREVTLEAGESIFLGFTLTDANGWACPWLYVHDGRTFQRRMEILRDVRGPDAERTEVSSLGPVQVVDGAITLRISEERDEVTFIDAFYLVIDGGRVAAQGDPDAAARVAVPDGRTLVLNRGDSVDFRFPVVDGVSPATVEVVVTGYYTPRPE